MSTTNDAIKYDQAMDGYTCVEVQAAGTTQGTATRITGQYTRVTGGALNAGVILPSIGTGELTCGKYVVVNDGPNNIKCYCAAGENHQGGGNGSLTINAGATGIFFPVPNHHGGTLDWRSAAIS